MFKIKRFKGYSLLLLGPLYCLITRREECKTGWLRNPRGKVLGFALGSVEVQCRFTGKMPKVRAGILRGRITIVNDGWVTYSRPRNCLMWTRPYFGDRIDGFEITWPFLVKTYIITLYVTWGITGDHHV